MNTSNQTQAKAHDSIIRLVGGLINLFFTIAIPIILTLISARMVMTPLFLEFEYNRSDFPEDIYGFTREDRLYYAPYALDYLIYNKDLSYLADLTFPDGQPLYNERELRHMYDVQVVARFAFLILTGLLIAAFIAACATFLREEWRGALLQGLLNGGLLTFGIIGVIVIVAVTSWNLFFNTFHEALFDPGTWRFPYSDTLIRLFPEQFWFDAALVTGTLTAIGAGLILLFVWIGNRYLQKT